MPGGVQIPSGSGSASPPEATKERKQAKRNVDETLPSDNDFFKPFNKPRYTRVFLENSKDSEYVVFVESTREEKLGNRNPLIMASLFKNEIKGVLNIKRINANKVGIIFKQAIDANNFIKNEAWLVKNGMKAFIPAGAVETIGVLRFVPTSISNEELFNKLSSKYEIIGVRRFTRKVNGEIKPYSSVSVTFLSKTLPECVYLDIYRFKVHEYVAPLLQCFKCFKFNHSAKICSNTQKCSICSMDHHFSQCTNSTIQKCINCGGQHLAISRDCPVKKQKLHEKQNKKSYAAAAAVSPKSDNYTTEFPALLSSRQSAPSVGVARQPTTKPTPPPKPQSVKTINNEKENNVNTTEKLIDEIINNDFVLKGLVGALVSLGNSNNNITTQLIKNTLIWNLKNG